MTEGDTMTGSTTDQWHLAALLDGEPGPDGFEAAIAAVEGDERLRGRFERGLIIGQVLRGEAALPEARRLSVAVSAALAKEPVIFAPTRGSSAGRARSRPPINRAAAGLAIAASLVAVAVLVGPGLVPGLDDDAHLGASTASPRLTSASTETAGETTQPTADRMTGSPRIAVSAGPEVGTGPDRDLGIDQGPDRVREPTMAVATREDLVLPDAQVVERWSMDAPAGSTALDTLLVDHRERASASALTGFIPYAAVVGRSGLR